MELKYEPFHEALKLLKEWSTALVVIQTGAMAVLGGLVKDSATLHAGELALMSSPRI